ncbi:hypothetical protein ACFO0A_11730 [Novosphingobium tardum]|uniref:Energy transducer TonB n=1 Tax=Novosphingobium tardum TaxID=1538021 RepID=A0ABV8RSI7_9SPHN
MAAHTLPSARFTPEERVGLAVAIAAHVGLVAWLALASLGKSVAPPPERMEVTIADEVALRSTSPEPSAQAAPDIAPTLGEPAPEAQSMVEPAPPAPISPPAPAPLPRPAPRPQPRAVAPAPRPAVVKPSPPKPAAARPAAKAPADERTRRRPDAPVGASRIGNDFLKGISGGQTAGTSRNPPAAAIGPGVAASLSSSIARQLKPHWSAPQGAEADQLVTILAWELKPDGSLAGRPRVVSQQGVTDANRAQKDRHAEQAIRAVQLAAPFDLPDQYYAAWKRVAAFRFDRKLSQ